MILFPTKYKLYLIKMSAKMAIIFCSMLFAFTNCIELVLEDGNDLVFNSSMRRETISVSLSSHGKINSSFFMES